jgi:mannosyltransferase
VSPKTRSILLLLIVLLAFALRVYRLDAQSIWYDEGLSLYLAQLPPDQTIALSATTDHPPLHALLLGGWIRVAGDSDFSDRFPSAFFGVLIVALTYRVGRFFGERAGLIAACLISIAPFPVYYSQEARGYTLLTALILVAAIAFIRLWSGEQKRWVWISYAAAMAAALYTHYFAAFAWAAFNAAWLVSWVVKRFMDHSNTQPLEINLRTLLSSRVARWLIVQLIILACFLPWLPNAIAQASSNATYFPGRVTWDTVVGDTWRAFSLGEWGTVMFVGWWWSILIGLSFAALLGSIKQRKDSAATWTMIAGFFWLGRLAAIEALHAGLDRPGRVFDPAAG